MHYAKKILMAAHKALRSGRPTAYRLDDFSPMSQAVLVGFRLKRRQKIFTPYGDIAKNLNS
jgi:hypothetical protein